MQLKLLIDGIVRQTTVLLARVSTGGGGRSPLGKIADQVFLELSRELEQQGMSKVLVADMFGLALRSYQRKTQRLLESSSEDQRSLWEAVYDFVRRGETTRSRVKARFKHDGEREVAAVLTDLVRSGLLHVTGAGDGAVYGANDERMRAFAQSTTDLDALVHYAWFKIFHGEVTTAAELQAELQCDQTKVDTIVGSLLREGRATLVDGRLGPVNLVIPVTAAAGSETALLDHFRAVTTVVAERVVRGPDPTHLTGGSTFSFLIDRDHPDFGEVERLLSNTRERTQALWERVMQHNAGHPPGAGAITFTFYAGESSIDPESETAVRASSEQEESANHDITA
jgi:hypothetical protein